MARTRGRGLAGYTATNPRTASILTFLHPRREFIHMSIGIKGKWVIAYDGAEHRLLRDGIVVTEGRIKHVGKSYQGDVDRWIDASHHVVIPGMICTHTHASTAPKDKSFIDDTGARHFYVS